MLLSQTVKVPLNDSTTIWCITHSSKFCFVCKLAEVALCPIVQVITEDVKQCWTQYQHLGHTVRDRQTAEFLAEG